MDPADYKYFEHFASSHSSQTKVVRIYCCPCCGYPTLEEPAGYYICDICSWEDDGCDGFGPNACSLAEARDNFTKYLTCYGSHHEISPQFQKPGFHFVHDRELSPVHLDAKRRKILILEKYMSEPDIKKRAAIWCELNKTA